MPTSSLPNSKSQVIILTLLQEHLTPTQAAADFGVSRQWIYQLLARYKAGSLQALEPISRRPHSNPRALSLDKKSDFTHWRLSEASDVEIINWLDDHPRLLLTCTFFKAITGKIERFLSTH